METPRPNSSFGSRTYNFLGQETPITDQKATSASLEASDSFQDSETPASRLSLAFNRLCIDAPNTPLSLSSTPFTPSSPTTQTSFPRLERKHSDSSVRSLLSDFEELEDEEEDILSPAKRQRLDTSATKAPAFAKINFLEALPADVSLKILKMLGPKDLCMVSAVCRNWRCLSGQDVLWRGLCRMEVDFEIGGGSWRAIYCDLRRYSGQAKSSTRRVSTPSDLQMRFGLYESPQTQGSLVPHRGPATNTALRRPALQPPTAQTDSMNIVVVCGEEEKENNVQGKVLPQRQSRLQPPSALLRGILLPCPMCTHHVQIRDPSPPPTTPPPLIPSLHIATCTHCGHLFCPSCHAPITAHIPGIPCTPQNNERSLGEVTNTVLAVTMTTTPSQPMKSHATPVRTATSRRAAAVPSVTPLDGLRGGQSSANINVKKGADLAGSKASKKNIQKRL